jgi:hypothetical protein
VSDARDAALQYLKFGWQPVAAPLRGKSPRGQWKRFQLERATLRDVEESFARPANVFLITGAISRLVVLDCDDQAAYDYWRNALGEILDETTAVRTGNGWHFYFRLPEGITVRNQSHVGDVMGKWDIRGEGGGVVAPPSVHPSGRRYKWERDPEHLQDLPQSLIDFTHDPEREAPGARSILTHLLQNPPSEGGRNVWLSKVAGHYAKYIPHEDAFAQMVWDANSRLFPPLPDEEVQKLIDSIWDTEQAKQGKAIPDLEEDGSDRWRQSLRKATEDNGWLVSGGTRIMIQVKTGRGEDASYGLAQWMDADVRVLGVVTREDEAANKHDMTYVIELRYPDGTTREDLLAAKDAADFRALTTWLANRNVTYSAPDNASPRRPSDHVRFLRYLKSQDAPPMEAVEALGWHEDSQAFISHTGVIRAAGPGPFEHVRPDSKLKQWAPYNYGFDMDEDQVRTLLAEVLTFHDETVTSIFGAWWAAVLLKPQIASRSSQFPFMAIEAPSESGKTKGFFSLMMQLSGNRAGQVNPTRAVLRDYLSGNSNGIVWVDDLDSLEEMGEVLRQVTVGGAIVKKGQDNTSQNKVVMRNALVVSGEALGLRDQKALADRAVPLSVPSPTGRTSLRGDHPQWNDIVNLIEDHPDLTRYAGTVIQMALRESAIVSDLRGLRVGAGRHSDTLAIIRLGARVLRGMLGPKGVGIVERVDDWVKEQSSIYTGSENALTLKLIPRALSSTGWLVRPEPPDDLHRKVATPAFVDEDEIVWFSPKLLSEWWEREPKSRKVIERTESSGALEDQARALGLGGRKGEGRKDFKLTGTQKAIRYWFCPPDLSVQLLARSRGTEGVEDAEEQIELD